MVLCAKNDQLYLKDYRCIMLEERGVQVATSTIDAFFKERFKRRGRLRVTTMVPLDKFMAQNIGNCNVFLTRTEQLSNHWKYHYMDEKHVVNSHCVNNCVQACPLSGRVRTIQVTGDFWHAYNLQKCILYTE